MIDLRQFELPSELEAPAPPARRDAVRLLVADPDDLQAARFDQLGDYLEPGDLLIVNTSAVLPAAVPGRRDSGQSVLVHFATALDDGTWVAEIRPRRSAIGPVAGIRIGERIALPGEVELTIDSAHPIGQIRLWRVRIALDTDVVSYLERVGRPIRYSYVSRPVPLRQYQTVFGREPGSAESPSAGRPFTASLVVDLVTRGIVIAPIRLHTGVSSQDAGEPPQPERFAVSPSTARLVNSTRAAGGRIVAVGTTATRALESATDEAALVHPRAGWTDLVLGPDRPARVVNGLITGWHAPGASHLELLQAIAGRHLVERAYAEALRSRYRWHEFGDSCLLLP